MFRRALFLKLLRDLWQSKLMLFALTAVLAAGVSSYVGMAAVYQDLDRARAEYYAEYNLASFTLDIKRAPETVLSQLQNVPNVYRLRTRIRTDVMVDLPGQQPIPGVALSLPVPRQEIINDIFLYTGRWFSYDEAPEVILNQQFAAMRNLKPGDRIQVRMIDKEQDLLVVGTAYSPEFVMVLPPGNEFAPDPKNYAVMYMPRRFLQDHSDLNGAFNQLLGMSGDNSLTAIQNTMDYLKGQLDIYGVQLQTAQQDQFSVKMLHDELENIQKTVNFFPSLFLLVAALILNVMLLRLIARQRSVIGTLKAMGYGNFTLVRHYLTYGVVVGVLGGVFGILVGLWLENGMLGMYKAYFSIPHMHMGFYLNIYIIGVLISVISTMLGSLFGAYQATKLEPAEAMRPPMPEVTRHIFIENFSRIWKKLTFQNKMIVRSIVRNPVRSSVTLCASIVATALVFSALGFFDSMYEMVNFSFDYVQHKDFDLSLREPLGLGIMGHLQLLPSVKEVEGQLNVPAELQNLPYYKLLNITGVPLQHHLFTPVDENKKPITINSTGLVITETLANQLHVHAGDYIRVRPLIGNRQMARAKVNAVVKSYLGMSVYANQAWLSQLLGNQWVANRILFKLQENANIPAFVKAVSQFGSMINLTATQEAKQSLLNTLNQFLGATVGVMVFFAGVIAVGAIINTAMISLNERERDVASLRILGFTHWQVTKIFFGESAILNAIGIFFGLFAGIALTYWMSIVFQTDIYRMPFIVRPWRLVETAGIMILFVLLSQMIIYHIIKKIQWLEVLNVRE